jgi:hypothetical protein
MRRGIGGTSVSPARGDGRRIGGIKCLHAHLAHHLVFGGVVGRLITAEVLHGTLNDEGFPWLGEGNGIG